MFRLMKYELRKQLFSKVMLVTIIGALEVMFLYGLFFEKEGTIATSMGLFVFVAMGTVAFVSMESILTYSNDLKTKQSYMIFLTPNSMFKVVGAKILTTIITIGLTAAAFMAVITLNLGIVLVKYDMIAQIVDILQKIMLAAFEQKIDYSFIILFIANFVIEIIRIVIIGIASITLSATFLSNSKLKGLVSVVFFFGITSVVGKISNLLLPSVAIIDSMAFMQMLIFECVVVSIFYFLTVWMLDKKVSV